MIEWLELSAAPAPALHSVALETRSASKMACIRLAGVRADDKVTVRLEHLERARYSFRAGVETFLDLWVDPYEFVPAHHGLERLPTPLVCVVEWAAGGAGQVLTPYEEPGDEPPAWAISAEVLEPATSEAREPERARSSLGEVVAALSEKHAVAPEKMALLALFSAQLVLSYQDPQRFFFGDAHAAKRAETRDEMQAEPSAKPKEKAPPLDEDESAMVERLKRLFAYYCIQYFPSFQDSSIVSWLSAVASAAVRDFNDQTGAELPEDVDLWQLMQAWCPPEPYRVGVDQGGCDSDFVGLLNARVVRQVREACASPAWRESIWAAALALSSPHLATCLPNSELRMETHSTHVSALVRNAAYCFLNTRLGADPSRWFERFGVDSERVKSAAHVFFNVSGFFADASEQWALKRLFVHILPAILERAGK